MLMPVVAVLVQALGASTAPAATEPAPRPVRVWLGTTGPIVLGEAARVYVETAVDGYLLVLRKTTDGRVDVLFPGNPKTDPYVTPGIYELRKPADQPAFVATEPAGTGLVLAALAPLPTPFRFAEFVQGGAWNPDALVGSWPSADPEGALTDIVQRMLGDGYFNYDLIAYSVVARPVAFESPLPEPSTPGSCIGCSFVTIIEPFVPLFCDPFFDTCHTFARFIRRPRVVDSGICVIGVTCPEGARSHALALNLRPRSRARVAPRGSAPTRFAMPQRPAAPPPLPPRSRRPDASTATVNRVARAVALPTVGRRAAVASRRAASGAHGAVVAVRPRVRLPRIPMWAPPTEAPRVEVASRPTAGLVPTSRASAVMLVESPPTSGAARSASGASALVPAASAAVSAPARRAVASGSALPTPSGASTSSQPRAIALPHAARAAVSVGVARRTSRPQ
jgi:hypothetical protein